MKICWGSHCLPSARQLSLRPSYIFVKWNSFALKIYYYFKNNIVQSITCLVCVSNIETENSRKK